MDKPDDVADDEDYKFASNAEQKTPGAWWRQGAAGGIAGAVSRTCTAPLDRLKTFLQVHPGKQRISDCFKNMLKEGGVTGLWRGNAINVWKIAPESALKFAVYDQMKKLIRGDNNSTTTNHHHHGLTIYQRFCAGAVAGIVSQTTIYPLEVLKTRLALRTTGQYRSIMDAASKIYRAEGIWAFYRGWIPNSLGILPYASIELSVYETLKRKYLESRTSKDKEQLIGFWVPLVCINTSSTLGILCSYPFALVQTRLQAQGTRPTISNPSVSTMRSTFKSIIEKDGVYGLYRGVTANFMKAVPAASITFLVYEYSSILLGVKMT